MRTLAAGVTDREAKETMLRIAHDYDHLAERVGLRQKSAPLA